MEPEEVKRRVNSEKSVMKWKWFGMSCLALLVLIGVFTVVSAVTPLGRFIKNPFRNETYAAADPVTLHKLQALSDLVVAEGTFDVPVVICNGKPKAYGDRKSARDLLDACTGFRDEKAVVLVRARVESSFDLSELDADDVIRDGESIKVKLPAPSLSQPVVDAVDGITIVGMKKSIWPGGLPDDYLARAAAAGKKAVLKVADQSGLRETGARSTQEIFQGLLETFGFDQVTVEVADK